MAVKKVEFGGQTLIDLTGDTVTANDVLSGKTFHANDGTVQSGSIATQAAQTITPTTTNQTIASGVYLAGTQTVLGDANLVASNIADGVTIFGVSGTHQGGGDTAPSLISRASGTYTYNVSYVGSYAFAGYAARSVSLAFPQCTSVYDYAFAHWAYASSGSRLVSIPNCTTIGAHAFDGFFSAPYSDVASVYAPKCVTISNHAFYNCAGMPEASFSMCTKIERYAFARSSTLGTAKLSILSFPQCSDIYEYAFQFQSGLTTVLFPECKALSFGAFNACTNLVSADFPKCVGLYSSATGSPTGVFLGCTNLTTISFPALKTINCQQAFANTHLTSVYLPALESAVSGVFARCSYFVSVNLPQVTFLGGSSTSANAAFNGCTALTDVSVPLLRTVGTYVFGGCTALTQIQLPSVTTIYASGFISCTALVSISIPICTTISTSAFVGCTSLSGIYAPSCTTIDTYAFQSCTALTTASFPALVSIPNSTAFRQCRNLISLYLLGSSVVTLSNSTAFSSTPIGGYSTVAGQYGSIYVPSSLYAAYLLATGWKSLNSARFVSVAM